MPDVHTPLARAVLVHLSDLHFSCDDPGLEARNALIREKVRGDLVTLLEEDVGARADAVLVTGDIAYGGAEEEYRKATAWLEEVMVPITNGSTRLLCVPGNHDVEWSKIGPTHAAHRGNVAGCLDEELDVLLDAYLSEDGQAVLHPLGAYNEFAASLGCQIEDAYSWETALPIGGGYQLDFRGITTVVNSHKNDGAGGLAVHSNQLLYMREPGRIAVLLAHHDTHFWRRHHRLDGDVTKRMSLALYGHTHSPRLRQVEQCLEVTGGAVQPEEGKDWLPAYNVIELHVRSGSSADTANLVVRVWRRRFSTDHDAFVPDVASGLFEERVLSILAAQADPPPEDATDHEEVRVALTTPEGEPHPIREVQRTLYNLGAGERITVLDRIGIDVSDLARLPPHRLIPRAAAAVIDHDKLTAFRAAVAGRDKPMQGDEDV